MSVLGSPIVPRVLLGIQGVLLIPLAWGAVESIFTDGLCMESLLMLLFAAPLAFVCLGVAAGFSGIWE